MDLSPLARKDAHTHAPTLPGPEELLARIGSLLEREPLRPWCVHRLREEFVEERAEARTEELLFEVRRAADLLVATGRAHREMVYAVQIGERPPDPAYWSYRSPHTELGQFGPEYDPSRSLHRLDARFERTGP